MYVGHYSRDAKFCALLDDFYVHHAAPVSSTLLQPGSLEMLSHMTKSEGNSDASVYIRRLNELAAAVSLVRLRESTRESRSLPDLSYGTLLIHRWCVTRATVESRGKKFGPDQFLQGDICAGPAMELSEPHAHSDVTVDFKASWDPRFATRKEAREELVKDFKNLLDQELDRITTEVEALDYDSTRKTNIYRDTLWLFWHVRAGLSHQQIATRWNLETKSDAKREAVTKALTRIAKHVGIE
jgi:hypothetical protein